ncbi:MAG: phage tail protein [Sulfurihydrogenibium sp.]|jgi:hypothetical protein|nr:phage tail protein [Sulfurihydrogenibium sp.]
MADFTGTVLTQKGRNLLSKAQTGATLTFTKIKIGDGTWATGTDPTQLNDLIDPKLSLSIQAIQVVGDGTVRLRFVLTNTGLQQGFFMREIGIYAQDPDLGEILYAVAYAGDRADFIPSDGTTKVENVVDIYTVIANSQNVVATISDTVVIATKQDVNNLNTQLTNQINTVNTQLTTQINTVNTQLTSQINTVKPEAGATAPSSTYTGKLWLNTNTNFLQYFDGSNWQNASVSNADKVDGFDASQTPKANMIPASNSSGKLDVGWIPFMFNSVSVISPSTNTVYQETAPCLIMVVSQDLYGLQLSPDGSNWYGIFGQEHYYNNNEGGTITFYVPKGWYWKYSGLNTSTNGNFSSSYWLKIIFNY